MKHEHVPTVMKRYLARKLLHIKICSGSSALKRQRLAKRMADPDVVAGITRLVQEKDIVVFSGDGCPYCAEAVRAIQAEKHEPHVVKASWCVGVSPPHGFLSSLFP
jgi:hypothetical protein